MSSGKIKSKVVLSAITDSSISSLFQEVVDGDSGTINLDIAWDKFTKMSTHCDRFLTTLDFFSKTKFISKFTNEYGAIRLFVENLKKSKSEVFALPDISIYKNMFTEKIDDSRVPKDELKTFIDKYKLLKNCEIVNVAIMTCNNLMHHRNYIGDEKNLQDKFLTHTAGNLLVLVKNLDINFKFLYNHEQTDREAKTIILATLNKLYTTSYDVYQAVSLPDIDVDQFVSIVRNSIGDLRTKIPRCDDAFDKIIDSIGTLKSNFGTYYKDYIASDNPTVIMENFILDVSKQTKASPKLTHQFRTIIKHYKQISSQGSQDPRLRSLFKHVDSNFSQLAKMSKTETPDAAPDKKDGFRATDKKDATTDKKDDLESGVEKKKAARPKSDIAKAKARRKKKSQNAKRKKLATSKIDNEPSHEEGTGLCGGSVLAESNTEKVSIDKDSSTQPVVQSNTNDEHVQNEQIPIAVPIVAPVSS